MRRVEGSVYSGREEGGAMGEGEPLGHVSFFVSREGDDAGPGTRVAPFRTLDRGLDAARLIEASQLGVRASVYVRSGSYWVRATMLGPLGSQPPPPLSQRATERPPPVAEAGTLPPSDAAGDRASVVTTRLRAVS
jgi:hypothetical protein